MTSVQPLLFAPPDLTGLPEEAIAILGKNLDADAEKHPHGCFSRQFFETFFSRFSPLFTEAGIEQDMGVVKNEDLLYPLLGSQVLKNHLTGESVTPDALNMRLRRAFEQITDTGFLDSVPNHSLRVAYTANLCIFFPQRSQLAPQVPLGSVIPAHDGLAADIQARVAEKSLEAELFLPVFQYRWGGLSGHEKATRQATTVAELAALERTINRYNKTKNKVELLPPVEISLSQA